MTDAALTSMLPLLRSLPDAAAVLGTDGEVLLTNDAARTALRLDGAGSSDFASLVDRPREDTITFLRMCARSTAPLPGSFAVVADGGARMDYMCKCGRLQVAEGEAPLLFMRFSPRQADDDPFRLLNQKLAELSAEVQRRRAVEEALRKSEAELRDRVQEAEQANRAKDEFLAVVSHELRNPLNAILGWARLLSGGDLSEEQSRRALETIERNAKVQAKLIEDVLDVSRIVSGRLRLEVQTIDPAAVIDAAIHTLRPSLDAKNQRLVLEVDPERGTLVADPQRLQQVIWNLLSNASKFTPAHGEIRVTLRAEPTRLIISVSDTGEGIAPAFLPKLFVHFSQADSSTRRMYGGLGLGLAIARHLVELHGGHIEARSAGLGTGSTFTIKLPRAQDQARAERVEQPLTWSSPAAVPSAAMPGGPGASAVDASALEGLSILVVDDEPDTRSLLTVALSQAGARVTAASSVEEALEMLGRAVPDVLLSDIGMPGQDGFDLIRQVRALPAKGGGLVPAAALTAYASTEDRRRVLLAGFQMHVAKPVEPSTIVEVARKLAANETGSR